MGSNCSSEGWYPLVPVHSTANKAIFFFVMCTHSLTISHVKKNILYFGQFIHIAGMHRYYFLLLWLITCEESLLLIPSCSLIVFYNEGLLYSFARFFSNV